MVVLTENARALLRAISVVANDDGFYKQGLCRSASGLSRSEHDSAQAELNQLDVTCGPDPWHLQRDGWQAIRELRQAERAERAEG